MKIAFAGLGVMGAPMARHLVNAGHDVTGFNRTTAKAQAWAAATGGRAAATLEEAAQGLPSHATGDLTAPPGLSDAEIRERMSGNICRCSAYPQILAAIRAVAGPAA